MSAFPTVAAAVSVLLGLFGEWRYRRLPEVQSGRPMGSLPSLSVIVPARNEAANLPRLLSSLRVSPYPGPYEVIVVDDGSDDDTGALAVEYGARVIRVDALPDGWMGKPHACHRGAVDAQGEWMLFTDADTVHRPGAAAVTVQWTLTNHYDVVSLFPRHARGEATVRLVLAVAFAGYFAGLTRTAGLLNGQYILIRRAAYEQSGGFAAVRAEPLEDLAFGHHLYALGYRMAVARGEHLVTVRMYDDIRQTWRGFTRLAALSLRWSGPGALLTALFTAATAAPVGTLVSACLTRTGRRRALLLWLLTCAGMMPWFGRLRVMPWALLSPLGAMFVQSAALWGILTRVLGIPLRWKGRAF